MEKSKVEVQKNKCDHYMETDFKKLGCDVGGEWT